MEPAVTDAQAQSNELQDMLESQPNMPDRFQQIFGFRAKEKQMEVLNNLLVDKKDVILLAKTGFGKSIVFQAPSLLQEGSITLVLLPLLTLQAEQAQKITHFGGRPCILNGDTNTREYRRSIGVKQYTHILTSPEIALSKEFNNDVLKDTGFSNHVNLFAVDELHLVEHWGRKFRPDYMNIAIIRRRLPAKVPMLGVTATMDTRLLKEIVSSAGFNPDIRIIRTALDRPEIYLQVVGMEGSSKSMEELSFLLSPSRPEIFTYDSIPKTIIFLDSILQVMRLTRLMRAWITRVGYPSNAWTWIESFFSAMPQSDKDRIAGEFSKPSAECKEVRILIGTDAYGLGIDNPDVVRVIQYGVPENMQVLCQRAGRAMRSGQQQAFFSMFVKSTLLGRRREAISTTDSLSNSARKAIESALKQREALPRGLFDFINPGDRSKCMRKTVLEFFDAVDASESARQIIPSICCSLCHPSAGLKIEPIIRVPNIIGGLASEKLKKKLEKWRRDAAVPLPGDFNSHLGAILPDKALKALAQRPLQIRNIDDLKLRLGFGWSGYEKHGNDILTIITEFAEEHERNKKALKEAQDNPPCPPAIRTATTKEVDATQKVIEAAREGLAREQSIRRLGRSTQEVHIERHLQPQESHLEMSATQDPAASLPCPNHAIESACNTALPKPGKPGRKRQLDENAKVDNPGRTWSKKPLNRQPREPLRSLINLTQYHPMKTRSRR